MIKETATRRFFVFHLPAIGYAGLIIGLSTITNVHLPKLQVIELDKVIHFIEYGLFTWLVYRSTSHLHRSLGGDEASFLALGFVTLFAFADEFYQSFVPGRQSSTADFLTDTAAAMVITAFLYLLARRPQRIIA